jgi:hypothetical protein
MSTSSEVTVRGRFLSLAFGALYLAIITQLYRELSGLPLAIAVLMVLAAAAAMIGVIAVFCAKWVRHPDDMRRMKLSTLFLPFIPISIYLALYRQLFALIPGDVIRDAPHVWWMLHIYFLAFVVLTTVVLLWFGEAIVWLALAIRRRLHMRHSPTVGPKK